MKMTQGGLNPEPEGKWHRHQGSGGWLLIGQTFSKDIELYLSESVLSWSWAAPHPHPHPQSPDHSRIQQWLSWFTQQHSGLHKVNVREEDS